MSATLIDTCTLTIPTNLFVGSFRTGSSALLRRFGVAIFSQSEAHLKQARDRKGSRFVVPNLNRSYVLEPFYNLISACQNNVLLGLRLVEEVEQFPGPTAEETKAFQLRFQDTAVQDGTDL